MNPRILSFSIPDWLNSGGPDDGIVISSRARLARNLKGYVYAHRAGKKELGEIFDVIVDAAAESGLGRDTVFRTNELETSDRNILIERHLISTALASKEGARGVLVAGSESASVMINEEDHLRIQAFLPGFDPETVYDKVRDMESKIADEVQFSFSKEFGYLTACPTNMGTGLRISVLIHLPALVLTKEIQKVLRSTSQLGFAVRGYKGEGTDIIGNMFQMSNQKSFGRTELEIIENLKTVIGNIIDYEKKSIGLLMKEASSQILDKVWRSIGILKTARVMSSHELINLISAVRLGLYLGLIEKHDSLMLNDLMISTQPEHLQAKHGAVLDAAERDVLRADIVRERFVDLNV